MFNFNQIFGSQEDQISVTEAYQLLQQEPKKTLLLDVRTEVEYRTPGGRVRVSKLIPLRVLIQRMQEIKKYKAKDVLVICATGNRSRTAVKILKQSGFDKAKNVSGGLSAWVRAGLPLS